MRNWSRNGYFAKSPQNPDSKYDTRYIIIFWELIWKYSNTHSPSLSEASCKENENDKSGGPSYRSEIKWFVQNKFQT